jgi:uncharacterized phiE125 gp8 family phage protein
MKLKVITPPAEEPLSIEECRAHLEAQPYEDSDVDPIDDTMIAGYLAGAREHCENFLGLSLSIRTLEIALDEFPASQSLDGRAIELPMGPVREIQFVTAVGEGSDGEIEPETYVLDDFTSPMRLVPADSWPSITKATNAIRIRYSAGYGVDSDGGTALPFAIRAAILVTMAKLYQTRGDLDDLPAGAQSLLRPLRVLLGMA